MSLPCPFEDGNGRIGRAISEKALSQGFGVPVVLSLSYAIEKNRKEYYTELKNAQQSLDITQWINYFIQMVIDSQNYVINNIQFTIKKTHYFDKYASSLNIRQEKAIRKMYDAGIDGFVGGMSTIKYTSINTCSKATSSRDLQNLVNLGALIKQGNGRSTRYVLP